MENLIAHLDLASKRVQYGIDLFLVQMILLFACAYILFEESSLLVEIITTVNQIIRLERLFLIKLCQLSVRMNRELDQSVTVMFL